MIIESITTLVDTLTLRVVVIVYFLPTSIEIYRMITAYTTTTFENLTLRVLLEYSLLTKVSHCKQS